MLNYVALGVFAAMLAAGQVFFKYAASSLKNKPVVDGFLELAQTPTFYAAVALYGAATLLWVWILSRVPLSQAYPWVALAMSAVPILAVVVFHERFDSSYWLGVGLVVLGVFLTQRASQGA
jgi:drug/metabolite transporter (DMT)-like permease